MLVWYAQELQSSCVAACVRMVLGELGAQVAEARVRRLIGHTRLGVSLTVAQLQLRHAGATALLHEDWSLDDLRDTLHAGYFRLWESNVTCSGTHAHFTRSSWSRSPVRR